MVSYLLAENKLRKGSSAKLHSFLIFGTLLNKLRSRLCDAARRPDKRLG